MVVVTACWLGQFDTTRHRMRVGRVRIERL